MDADSSTDENREDDAEEPPEMPESSRREVMAGAFIGAAMFSDLDFWVFGNGVEDVNQLMDGDEAVIDLDDIKNVRLGDTLSAEKDGGDVLIDGQTLTELLTILDSGTEVATSVGELDFGTDLDVSSTESGVQIDASVSSSGGPTVVASDTTFVNDQSKTVELSIPQAGHYILTGYPEESLTGDFAAGVSIDTSSPAAYATMYLDDDTGSWVIDFYDSSNYNPDGVTIHWKVYEL